MDFKLFLLWIFVTTISCREFELESFTPSANTDPNLIDYGTVRVKKINRNQFALTGNFELKKNIGNEKQVRLDGVKLIFTFVIFDSQIVFEIFLPSGDLLIRNKQPMCDFTKKDTLVWPDLIDASNLPKNRPCPFPKGNYTIDNFVINDSKFGPLPYGKFLVKGKLLEDGKTLTHIDIVAWLKR